MGLVAAALCGCATPEPPAPSSDAPRMTIAAPQATVKSSVERFGAEITEATSTPLSTIAADPAKFDGRIVRTEGTVTAVCKARGCWMDLGDEPATAHVRMAGHGFFVPKSAAGRRAIVQAKVVGAPSENACKDGCGPQQLSKVELEATGVRFVD
jgi:hypothetical protein